MFIDIIICLIGTVALAISGSMFHNAQTHKWDKIYWREGMMVYSGLIAILYGSPVVMVITEVVFKHFRWFGW